MALKRRPVFFLSLLLSPLSSANNSTLTRRGGRMIVPKHRSSAEGGRQAKDRRAYNIRNDVRDAALRCRKTKVTKFQRPATRPRTSTHCMSTRGVTTQQSRDAVMETAELFEAVLLQLPMTDLINYRQVNKTWFRTIHGTPKLRQKMFLSPTPSDTHPLWIYNHEHVTLQEYSTRNEDLRAIRTPEQHAAYELWRKQHYMMRPSLLNPVLLTIDEPHLRGSLLRRASICESIRFRFAPDLRKLGTPNIYHEMYLCQPPVAEIHVQFFYHLDKSLRRGRPLTTGPHGLVVKREGGVKFKDILQAFLSHVEEGSLLWPSSTGCHIEVRPQKGFRSVAYLLGAIFADQDEKRQIEGEVESKVVSPMAKRMMRRDSCPGRETVEKQEREGWTMEDEDWTEMALGASAAGDFVWR